MRTSHYFLIESDRARHDLILDGDLIASFPTFEAAEAEAKRIASRVAPDASLQFGLDMKSTLDNLEIRGATFDTDTASADTPLEDAVSKQRHISDAYDEITQLENEHIIRRSYRECPGGRLLTLDDTVEFFKAL